MSLLGSRRTNKRFMPLYERVSVHCTFAFEFLVNIQLRRILVSPPLARMYADERMHLAEKLILQRKMHGIMQNKESPELLMNVEVSWKKNTYTVFQCLL